MNNIIAILSLLHQSPPRPSSAGRLFRREPVLAWTLKRLGGSRSIRNRTILCWEDQLPLVRPIAASHGCHVLSKSPRCDIASVQSIAAARKWADGWRGGLLSATCFDQGFYAPWFNEIRQQFGADAVVIIDPDSALIDPALVDSVVAHAREHSAIEYCFSPAAPGLSGALIRAGLLEQLSGSTGYLGRLLNYYPDLPGRDPISKDECAPVPTSVARTPLRFTLDSDRQISRVERATLSLNGQLMQTHAESLVATLAGVVPVEGLPRDITLELNTKRATWPVFSPARHLSISRPDLSVADARSLFRQLGAMDDIRLTLAGVGDPLLSPEVFRIIQLAHEAGIDSVHVETDLLSLSESALNELAGSRADILSVHIPALTPAVYERVMGVEGLSSVISNIRQFLLHRQAAGRACPVLVPTFTKCRDNICEMEAWYDYWLRAVGCAVINGASDFAGQIPDQSVADMSPPSRCPCRRLASRLTVLSDLSVVSCEQDVCARRVLGNLRDRPLREILEDGLMSLRRAQADGQYGVHPLCPACREWHRP